MNKGSVNLISPVIPLRNLYALDLSEAGGWGLSSNGTGMYAKGVDRYLPEMRLRRIQE